MNPIGTTIELGRFKSTRDEYRHALPFAIYFVYTPNGFYVVKGMSEQVKEGVKGAFPNAVYFYTYWKNGEWRGSWGSTCAIYWTPEKIGNRTKYLLSMNTAEGYKPKIMTVRRIPRKWLPVYDQALPRK